MAGPLKNPKHEKFAHGLAKGKSQLVAYVAAGYKSDDGAAARLSGNIRVRDRVAELQAKTAEKVVTTAADIARQLDEDRAFARKHKQSSAAVSATMGKAKVLGLVTDRVQHGGRVQTDVHVDLTDATTDQLNALKQFFTGAIARSEDGAEVGRRGTGAPGA